MLAIERLGDHGLDGADFRRESLHQLRSLLSVDAAFFASVDPATLLFTAALAEEPLAAATSQFLDNEFARADVNKIFPAWPPRPIRSARSIMRREETERRVRGTGR